jgi:hypothetical protein
MFPQGNVLIDVNGAAVLSDAMFDTVTFIEDEYCSIPSICWWLPHERLIADDDNNDMCAVAPRSPSLSADIYGVALTVMQVRFIMHAFWFAFYNDLLPWQIWTLRRPFYRMHNEYELIVTLRKFRAGQLAQLELPDEVPVAVCTVFRECLCVEPLVRPTADNLLASFEAFLRI